MRNLLGRLHARDDAELGRIASFWRAPLAGRNRHVAVGALYRVMTDIRLVRAAWERLDPAQQEMVRVLALADDAEAAPTLATLTGWLDLPEGEAREVAVNLYRAGLLAREGDDQPLPIGAEPKLFLPRELALLFRRLLDDIDAGDLSRVPLAALLERLDDAEIEVAATRWGLKVVPGIRNREDLARRLLRQIATGSVSRVADKFAADAARVWRVVWDAPGGSRVRLAEVAAAVGLDADAPQPAQRWRAALDELESALLVWHTYDADGARWLFIPAEIRSPAAPAPLELPPLRPVPASASEPQSRRHPDAIAWDLLTLLRELSDPGLPPWAAGGDQPRARLRRVNHRFWIRGREQPQPGYVECLLALAIAEGLVRIDEDDDEPALRVTPAVRRWRERSFPAQTERLRWWWTASPEWIEGNARGEIEIWGADWPAARRGLIAALVDPAVGLEPGTWYELESVAARIAAYRPDLLGASFTAATAKRSPGDGDEAATRQATMAEVVHIELLTMGAWLGLVEVQTGAGSPPALRVAEAVQAAASRAPTAAIPGEARPSPALVVSASGAIELRDPIPLRVWSLSAFADLELLGQPTVYRLTAASLQRALAAGFDLGQVTAFLTRQSGADLPEEVAAQLDAWTTGYRRVRAQPAVVLTPDDATAIEPLRALVTSAGWTVILADEGSLVIRRQAGTESLVEADLVDLLRAHGYAPLVSAVRSLGSSKDGRRSGSGDSD